MRPTYVRPLVVTFSAFGLACLFSYAAVSFTDADPARPATKTEAPQEAAAERSPEAKAAAALILHFADGAVEARVEPGGRASYVKPMPEQPDLF